MIDHQFKIGDRVKLSESLARRTVDVFEVTRLVPAEREDLEPRYRVKAKSETHERLVAQDEILRA